MLCGYKNKQKSLPCGRLFVGVMLNYFTTAVESAG